MEVLLFAALSGILPGGQRFHVTWEPEAYGFALMQINRAAIDGDENSGRD